MLGALLTALVIDFLVLLAEEQEFRHEPGSYLVGRRLDDLAYGAALWRGAVRARSSRALLPRRPGP